MSNAASDQREVDAHAVLERHYRSAVPPAATLTLVKSGMSGARVWQAASGSRRWAVRRWPPPAAGGVGWSPDRVAFIHAVLRHAAQSVS
ncbi:MAG: hypothetical protein AAGB00_10910, partial [Planctomycetota bacterium]